MRRDTTCGVFLVMANDQPIGAPGDFTGFFLRDSDPVTKADTNSDLLLERGDKTLARQWGITLDNSWSPAFRFQGKGIRESDDFSMNLTQQVWLIQGRYGQFRLLVHAFYTGRL